MRPAAGWLCTFDILAAAVRNHPPSPAPLTPNRLVLVVTGLLSQWTAAICDPFCVTSSLRAACRAVSRMLLQLDSRWY